MLRKQAFSLADKHRLVTVPTREKFPKGLPGWQKLGKSYDGGLWEVATGFGICAGEVSGITVIDIDAPDREWFDAFWAQSGPAHGIVEIQN